MCDPARKPADGVKRDYKVGDRVVVVGLNTTKSDHGLEVGTEVGVKEVAGGGPGSGFISDTRSARWDFDPWVPFEDVRPAAAQPADRHQDRTVAGTKLRVKETHAHPWTDETLVEGREVTVRRALGGGRYVELKEFPGTMWRRDRFEDSPSSPAPSFPPLRSGQKIVAVRDTESLVGKKIPAGTVGTYGSAVAFADPSAARAVVTFPTVANYGLSVARADFEPYVEPLRPALAHLPVRPADPGPVIRTSDGTVVLSPSRPPVLYARQDQTDARFEGLARELRAAKKAVEEQGRAIEKLLADTPDDPTTPSLEALAKAIGSGGAPTGPRGELRAILPSAAARRVRLLLKEHARRV